MRANLKRHHPRDPEYLLKKIYDIFGPTDPELQKILGQYVEKNSVNRGLERQKAEKIEGWKNKI